MTFIARCSKNLDTEMTETEEKLAQEEYEERLLSNPSTATAGERAATKNPITDQSSEHTSTVKQGNMSGDVAKRPHCQTC